MKILFLGDVVGISGCSKIMNNLKSEIDRKNIDFVIVNGENSAEPGVGLTENICNRFEPLFNASSSKAVLGVSNHKNPSAKTWTASGLLLKLGVIQD